MRYAAESTVLGKLFLLFTIVPLAELYLLLHVGEWMGAGPTIALVLVTGLLGASLAKREGARVYRSWQESMAKMEMPKEGVMSGLLVLVGGVLLVTPGVFTDFFGLALLFPPTRRFFARRLQNYIQRRFQVRTMQMDSMGPMGAGFAGGPEAGPFGSGAADVIDVEAERTETD